MPLFGILMIAFKNLLSEKVFFANAEKRPDTHVLDADPLTEDLLQSGLFWNI
jgi:hypothetical protein